MSEDRSNSEKERARKALQSRVANNPMRTTSAAQRRAARRARDGQRPRAVTAAHLDARERQREAPKPKQSGLSQEQIAHLLHNPTRIVTEDELRAEYSHVLTDIRSMAILAVALMVTLVVLALVLPR